MSLLDLSGLIELDKFVASFITEMKKYQPVTCYNLPGCIKKALEDQGLEYKNGEIVKIQSKVSAESEDEKIRQFLTHAWLEKQGNPNTEYWKGYKDGKKAILDRYSETHKIVEPKFNIGDWIVSDLDDVNEDFRLCKIIDIEDGCYTIQSDKDCKGYNFFEIWESDYHLWSIEDAKPGDVLAVDSMPFIYNGSKNEVTVGAYCGFNAKHRFSFAYNYVINQNITPATKEQRNILFQKMKEAGYTFDFEKKELKKLKFKVGDEVITENEKSLTITKIDEEGYWSNDLFICGFNTEHVWNLVEQKPTWSEEDDMMLECVLDKIGDLGTGVMCKGWLKSLKNRIKGE